MTAPISTPMPPLPMFGFHAVDQSLDDLAEDIRNYATEYARTYASQQTAAMAQEVADLKEALRRAHEGNEMKWEAKLFNSQWRAQFDRAESAEKEVTELRQRQEWIDKVGPPNHPDDERHWVMAYLMAQKEAAELRKLLRRVSEDVATESALRGIFPDVFAAIDLQLQRERKA